MPGDDFFKVSEVVVIQQHNSQVKQLDDRAFDDTLVIIFPVRDRYFDKMLRHERVDKLGPFDEAKVTAIEIVLITNVEDLLKFLNTIEVEVEDRLFLDGRILVYEGEGRAVHLVGDAKLVAQVLYQGGFSGAHRSIESNDIRLIAPADKQFRHLCQLIHTIYFKNHIHNYFALR